MSTPQTTWSAQVLGESHRPPVVLLHSIATRGAMWSPQLAVWQKHLQLIVPDLPGHGATPVDPKLSKFEDYAQALACLLDTLGIRRAAIVGLSLGGMIAQAFALQYPQRLSTLVLAQTSARTLPAVSEMWETRKQAARDLGMSSQRSATLQRWFTADFLSTAPLTSQWIGDMIAATSVEGYCAAAAAIQQLDFLERLSMIATPTLVVAGAEDTAASPALAKAICERLPSRLALIEHAAHLANIEQPLAFTEIVGGFLSEVLLDGNDRHSAQPLQKTSLGHVS